MKRERKRRRNLKEVKKMDLKVIGRAEDVEQVIRELIDYMGEKLRIIVEPCPTKENEPRKYYVEVERKKQTKNKM